MLALKINGTYLDLSDDMSITMKFMSPIFNTVGDHSYPFKLPASSKNVKVLGWKHRVENVNDPYEEFETTVEWNGVLLLQGNLKIKKAYASYYDSVLYMNKGDFNYLSKKKDLQQIDFGSLSFDSEDDAIVYLTQSLGGFYPDFPVACPRIFNDLYFDPVTEDGELQFFNYMYENNLLRIRTITNNERTLIVPMMYFRYVLDKLIDGMGYSLEDHVFSTHEDYNRLVLYNSTCCNNAGNNAPPRIPTNYSLSNILLSLHVPRILISDFVKSIEEFFGVSFFVNRNTKTIRIISLNDVITSNEYIDFSKDVLSITVDVEERRIGYHLKMEVDGDDDKMNLLTGIEDILIKNIKGSVTYISELPQFPMAEIGDVYWVESENNWYVQDFDKTWGVTVVVNLLKTQFYFRNGEQEKTTKLSSPLYDSINQYMAVGNKMASYRDITPRIFFVEAYDLMGVQGIEGKNDTNNFSLFYPWENGLFNKFWKKFMIFRLATKSVTIQRYLSIKDLQDLDFSRKYMMNGTKYLLSEVQVAFTKSSIKPATIKAYTCF